MNEIYVILQKEEPTKGRKQSYFVQRFFGFFTDRESAQKKCDSLNTLEQDDYYGVGTMQNRTKFP